MKWLDKYRYRKQQKKIMKTYLETCIKSPFEKIGISKVGDVVHKLELNGIEIESKEPIFIREE